MKKKLSRILGVGLVLMLLVSLIVVATPALAQAPPDGAPPDGEPAAEEEEGPPAAPPGPPTLQWLPDKSISDLAKDLIVLPGTDITDIATNGDTIYLSAEFMEAITWEVTTAPADTTTDATVTVTYVDQDYNTPETTAAFTVPSDAEEGDGPAPPVTTIPLNGTDTGVRYVTDITLTGGWASATAGEVTIKGNTTGNTLGTIDYNDTFTAGEVVDYPQAQYPLLKSIDGGSSWSNMNTSTDFPIEPEGYYVKAVAVAQDDPDVVAFITSSDNVCYSDDGGASWSNLREPNTTTADTLNCIDVSSGTERYVAVGGTDGTDAVFYTIKLAMAEGWADRAIVANGFQDNQASVLAVKFSPNYVTDKIITAISANDTTDVFFQVFWYENLKWNNSVDAYYAPTANYPVLITCSTPPVADLALADTYLGTDEYERLAFVSVAGGASEDGLYRLNDYVKKEVITYQSGTTGPMMSVAYHPDGKVLAGGYDASNYAAYLLEDPTATEPRLGRLNTLKQPGGVEKIIVGWAGDTAVAVTYGDEGAFAVSTDDGYSWNDVAVIDTTIGNDVMMPGGFSAVTDIAISADGSKTYMATYSSNPPGGDTVADVSVWLKEASWSRVLSLPNQTSTRDLLVRLAPEDDSAVYVADKNSQDIWVSQNSGQESWKKVTCYKLGTASEHIVDLVVESADVVYVVDNDGCSKTSNGGTSFGKQTKPDEGIVPHMITLAPNGDVLIGDENGYVAVSKDGGATWERLDSIPGASGVYVVADDDYADNGTLYASYYSDTDKETKVYRGSAGLWTDTGCTSDSSHAVVGMAQYEEATYVMTSNDTCSRLYRALKLETGVSAALCDWSFVDAVFTAGNLVYTAQPQAMKMSVTGTTITVYAVSNLFGLSSYADPIALVGPTLRSPDDSANIKVSSQGQAFNVTFVWWRYPDTDITEMQLQIATDSKFNAIVYDYTFTGIDTDTIAKVVGPTLSDPQTAQFNPGDTYYWRVRVAETGPLYSPWSEPARSFTIESVDVFSVSSPEVGATGVSITPTLTWADYEGATSYEVMVAEDPTFAILDWSHTSDSTFYASDEALKYSTTYYWRVRASAPEVGPWVNSVFTTEAEPVVDEPTEIVVTPPDVTVEPPEVIVEGQQAIPDSLLWTIIGIGAILIIALIVLIVRTRRVA